VLDGNNPRFPRKPSTTMLTHRRAGTTEDSATDRGTHVRFSSRQARTHQTDTQPQPGTRIFPPHGGPEGPWVADAKIPCYPVAGRVSSSAGPPRRW